MKALPVKNTLHSQVNCQLKYFVSVKSRKKKLLKLADPRITRVALALMDMQAVMGGAASHWGGPAAFAEVISAVFALVFDQAHKRQLPWWKLFHIINDAGHHENGMYALKANYGLGGLNFSDLKGFRSINSPLTGHGEAHLFPEGVYLSNGPLGSTLAQAQGLCMADRLQKNNRLTIVFISDGALMEGEAKEALSSIAGLSRKKQLNPFLLIVSDNNTKLSGRIDKDSFSLDPTLKSLSTLGWQVHTLQKAHHLKTCVDTIESALDKMLSNNLLAPLCIRAKTIKGYGLKMAENSEHGGHGWPIKDPKKLSQALREIYGPHLPQEFVDWCQKLEKAVFKKAPLLSYLSKQKNRATPKLLSVPKVKVQEGISRALLEAGTKKLPIISISADLQGSTGVLAFRKKYPAQSFEVGVAEANMISAACGFSKQGFIPVVDTFTQFGVTKGALPLFMANLSQAPVIALFSHAGLQDAADGASHQSLTYLAQTGALPLTNVYSLSSAEEAFHLVLQAIQSFVVAKKHKKIPKTCIFFFGRETFPPTFLPKTKSSYVLNKSQLVFTTNCPSNTKKGATIVATGTLLEQAIIAAHYLKEKDWNIQVINASIINHPDTLLVKTCLKATNNCLLTIEDHYLTGGMGALLAHALLLEGVKIKLQSMAVKSDFGRSAYQAHHLYKKEKLTAFDIITTIRSQWG